MKSYFYFIALSIPIVWMSCESPDSQPEEPTAFSSLEGSWRLVNYRTEDDTTWKQHPDHVIYEKHITPTHFYWIRYDTQNDSLVGAGGGTYQFDSASQKYTEDIEFFMPTGSTILGQTIPFDVTYEDGQWHHKGFSKDYEFDPDLGENVVSDSSLIDEIWERTGQPVEDSTLVGTWILRSQLLPNDSIMTEYPDFMRYLKLITPSHFAWVQYNASADELMGAGGGTYQFDGEGNYIEHLKFFYPLGDNVVGQSIEFTADFEEDGSWHHQGEFQDSSRIDEYWERYSPQM